MENFRTPNKDILATMLEVFTTQVHDLHKHHDTAAYISAVIYNEQTSLNNLPTIHDLKEEIELSVETLEQLMSKAQDIKRFLSERFTDE